MREVVLTEEFKAFFALLKPQVRVKMLYSVEAVQELSVISVKLVKKLVGTDYYELRVSMDNERLFGLFHRSYF